VLCCCWLFISFQLAALSKLGSSRLGWAVMVAFWNSVLWQGACTVSCMLCAAVKLLSMGMVGW
jgi:hypothetical protein